MRFKKSCSQEFTCCFLVINLVSDWVVLFVTAGSIYGQLTDCIFFFIHTQKSVLDSGLFIFFFYLEFWWDCEQSLWLGAGVIILPKASCNLLNAFTDNAGRECMGVEMYTSLLFINEICNTGPRVKSDLNNKLWSNFIPFHQGDTK